MSAQTTLSSAIVKSVSAPASPRQQSRQRVTARRDNRPAIRRSQVGIGHVGHLLLSRRSHAFMTDALPREAPFSAASLAAFAASKILHGRPWTSASRRDLGRPRVVPPAPRACAARSLARSPLSARSLSGRRDRGWRLAASVFASLHAIAFRWQIELWRHYR